MREEFDRIMKQNLQAMAAKKVSNWQNVENYYSQLKAWWNADMKYKKPEPPKKVVEVPVVRRRSQQAVSFSGTANGTITGVVSDQFGQPLAGANILIKGKRQGTQSDFDGKYSINAKVGETLVYEFIGMESQ